MDSGAGAKFSALAFDIRSCNPAVAYSDDIDKDGWLDTLKFAYWDGTSWKIEIEKEDCEARANKERPRIAYAR